MNSKHCFLYGALALALTSCASAPSGISPRGQGKDGYVIRKSAANGQAGVIDLKIEAVREADRFCAQKGKLMHVESTDETGPPYILGQHPQIATTFTCTN